MVVDLGMRRNLLGRNRGKNDTRDDEAYEKQNDDHETHPLTCCVTKR